MTIVEIGFASFVFIKCSVVICMHISCDLV